MSFVDCFTLYPLFPSSALLELRATLLDGCLKQIKNEEKGESSEQAKGSSKLSQERFKRIDLDFRLDKNLL